MIPIERETLTALVGRAQRAAAENPDEHRALADARQLLEEDYTAQFPVTENPAPGEAEQLTLFDPAPYDTTPII